MKERKKERKWGRFMVSESYSPGTHMTQAEIIVLFSPATKMEHL